MIDPWTLAQLLKDVSPSFEMIEGRLFVDRDSLGSDKLREAIGQYKNLEEAQFWMNIVPIDTLLDDVCVSWSIEDPAIDAIASIYLRSWQTAILSRFGYRKDVSLEIYKDAELDDVFIILRQAS